jgi:hypothetical protein
MINQKILTYISVERQKGKDDSIIRKKLGMAGWKEDDIEVAFKEVENDLSDVPRPDSEGGQVSDPKKGWHLTVNDSVSMWDAFEHALLFISMYVCAFSIALILHWLVDEYLPATLYSSSGYSSSSYRNSWDDSLLRGYVSAMLVSTPLFVYLFLRISRRTKENPTLRSLRARKILTYLTLIGTFLFLIYSAITIVYSLLGGNITVNFLLHFVITVAVSGVIFKYYLSEVKEDRKLHA